MLKLVSPCCCRTNLNSMFSRLVRCRSKTHKQRSTFHCLSILNWLNVFNCTLRDMKCWFCRLSSAIVMTDYNMRLLPLALWSVNPCFELPTVFIIKYLINPSMEYLHLVALCPKLCKNMVGQGFHTAAVIVRQWATLFFVKRSNSN